MNTLTLCRFDGVGPITRRTTYEQLRERALAAGRFSVFEATASPHAARLYNMLCGDPDIETRAVDFPWTTVREREHRA